MAQQNGHSFERYALFQQAHCERVAEAVGPVRNLAFLENLGNATSGVVEAQHDPVLVVRT